MHSNSTIEPAFVIFSHSLPKILACVCNHCKNASAFYAVLAFLQTALFQFKHNFLSTNKFSNIFRSKKAMNEIKHRHVLSFTYLSTIEKAVNFLAFSCFYIFFFSFFFKTSNCVWINKIVSPKGCFCSCPIVADKKLASRVFGVFEKVFGIAFARHVGNLFDAIDRSRSKCDSVTDTEPEAVRTPYVTKSIRRYQFQM